MAAKKRTTKSGGSRKRSTKKRTGAAKKSASRATKSRSSTSRASKRTTKATKGASKSATKKRSSKGATKKRSTKGATKSAQKRSGSGRYGPKSQQKVGEKLHEMKRGQLKSGSSGRTVKSPKQAIAIALSEARREGGKVPPAPQKRGRKR